MEGGRLRCPKLLDVTSASGRPHRRFAKTWGDARHWLRRAASDAAVRWRALPSVVGRVARAAPAIIPESEREVREPAPQLARATPENVSPVVPVGSSGPDATGSTPADRSPTAQVTPARESEEQSRREAESAAAERERAAAAEIERQKRETELLAARRATELQARRREAARREEAEKPSRREPAPSADRLKSGSRSARVERDRSDRAWVVALTLLRV